MQTLNYIARFRLLLLGTMILVVVQACGITEKVATRGKVDNQLVGHYWDYYGTSDLELDSNGEYRFIGQGGSNSRNGTWGAEGNTLYFDGKPCRYTYGKNPHGTRDDVLNIQCGDGSVVDRLWTRKLGGR